MSLLNIQCATFKYTSPDGQVCTWPALFVDDSISYRSAYSEFTMILSGIYTTYMIAKIEIKLPGEPLVSWLEFKKSLGERGE